MSRPLALLPVVALIGALTACSSATSEEAPTMTPTDDAGAQPTAAAEEPAPPPADPAADVAPAGLYALDATSLEGEDSPLAQYAGQVTVVVNVASRCGYTPQYADLQELYEDYADRGVVVLGFPSNEFGGQEPGSPAEIREFCTQNYGVTFPMFSKCETQPGDGQSPVYAFLQEQTGDVPRWNFCKYVIGRDGQPVGFFQSSTSPDDPALRNAINAAL